MKKTVCMVLTLTMLALPAAARAQDADQPQHDMSTMEMQPGMEGAAKAYMEGMAKMSRDMNAAMTGDADIDFATMMIPHHQGAIDMAKIQLEHGKDAELRKLSEGIIKAQESEIAFMKNWLAKH